jgi:hypothetical protein
MVDFVGMHKDRTIVPCTAGDLESLERVSRGVPCFVTLRFDRSVQHNRWFHKLLSVVADGLGMPMLTLKAELKFKAGLISNIMLSQKFGVAVELYSTAFDQMDESKFNDFRRIAVEVLFRDYLPGVKRRDVYKQVADLMGEPCPWDRIAA